jgi:hypothetical protein
MKDSDIPTEHKEYVSKLSDICTKISDIIEKLKKDFIYTKNKEVDFFKKNQSYIKIISNDFKSL